MAGRIFTRKQLIRHGHTDPAGIVYYPRYFEMINDTVEDFFREAMERPFGQMHTIEKIGVPTVQIAVEFQKPSYCDDVLDMGLVIERLGKSSATICVKALCGGEVRLSAILTIVQTNLETMKSIPFSGPMRVMLSEYVVDTGQTETI